MEKLVTNRGVKVRGNSNSKNFNEEKKIKINNKIKNSWLTKTQKKK